MAEAAGLVIGAVALASLFKDCLELYSCFSAAKSLGKEYQIIEAMLDIEKTIFLQWANRVRLVEDDYDQRLNNPDMATTIYQVLSSIRLLLSDSHELQEKYGLRNPTNDEAVVSTPVMSVTRMAHFTARFQAMALEVQQRQSGTSLAKKISWVVKDKVQFEGLVTRLSHFNAKLGQLVPEVPQGLQTSTMMVEDVESLRGPGTLRLVLKASKGRHRMIAEQAEKAMVDVCQHRIIQTIWYRGINERRNQVKHPHAETFEWAVKPRDPGAKWDDLPTWLESGSGIYWISGKAGSGKSTLMKFLYGHDETHRLLKAWSGNSKLTMPHFFLWNLGSSDQHSQHGLLKGLLYHVLESQPSLVPILLPDMWKEAWMELQEDEPQNTRVPSVVEMEMALSHLASLGDSIQCRFCFFVDGLDEYSSDIYSGIKLLQTLSQSPAIKVIVSSRPIPVCAAAFSTFPGLRLQDLTKKDIVSYVESTVGCHPYMTELQRSDSLGTARILKDLVRKASGVFLWVVLACQSLLEGFASFDSIADLQRRIDELPPELEDLFRHIIERIPVRYRAQAAELLKLRYQKQVIADTEPLYALGLAMAQDYPTLSELGTISCQERHSKCQVLEGRLGSRCWGLLEVKPVSEEAVDEGLRACFCLGDEGNHNILVDSTVEFLHRSVFEFLSTPGVWELESLQTNEALFEPNATLAAISLHLARIKVVENGVLDSHDFFKDVWLYSYHADAAAPNLAARVLLQLELQIAGNAAKTYERSRLSKYVIEFAKWEVGQCSYLALALAAEIGMVNFVRYSLAPSDVEPLGGIKLPILYHAISRPFMTAISSIPCPPTAEVVGYALECGFDPNGEFEDEHNRRATPWTRWLQDMHGRDFKTLKVALEVTKKFLKAPVDLEVVPRILGETVDGKVKRLVDGYGWMSGGLALRVDRQEILELIRSRQLRTEGCLDGGFVRSSLENSGDAEQKSVGTVTTKRPCPFSGEGEPALKKNIGNGT